MPEQREHISKHSQYQSNLQLMIWSLSTAIFQIKKKYLIFLGLRA